MDYYLPSNTTAVISLIHEQEDLNRSPELRFFRLYGPECTGCKNYQKIVMLTYQSVSSDEIIDIFLGPAATSIFLSQLEQLQPENFQGLTLKFETQLEPQTILLRPSADQWQTFMQDVASNKEEIANYISRWEAHPYPEPVPKRMQPLTEQERIALQKQLDDYYKPDPRNIPLEGIDPGTLLAALYNNAKTGGRGTQHFRSSQMTPEEGRHILCEVKRIGALPEFDYINGRCIKVWFEHLESNPTLHHSRFWDYNDLPLTFVLAYAQSGRYERMHGQGILDVENELRILGKATTKEFNAAHEESSNRTSEDHQKALSEHQQEYVASRMPQQPNVRYQISIAGNGPVTGEIGHLITPYLSGLSPDPDDPQLH